MQIIVNGTARNLDKIVTIQDLLEELQLTGRLAVELNKEIIPRSSYGIRKIKTGDAIEIVHAIGGG